MNSLQIFLDGWCESNYYALYSRDKEKYCCRYFFKANLATTKESWPRICEFNYEGSFINLSNICY